MQYGTVLALGDSLTRGARGVTGYPERLGPMMSDELNEWIALNRGISGQTTWEILDRAPAAVRELAALSGPKWFVLLAGTNDSKRGGTNIDVWELHYRQILHWPRRYGIPIALCTLPSVDSGRMPDFVDSTPWLFEANRRIRSIARELHNAPVPVRVVDLSTLTFDMLCDGVHLTDDGYYEVARRVAARLRHPDTNGRTFEIAPGVEMDTSSPHDDEIEHEEEDAPVPPDSKPTVQAEEP